MLDPAEKTLHLKCLRLMLRPIVRFCLRRSLFLNDFLRAAKLVFVEIAEEEIRKSTEKINVSRLSVMTGVHRRDVTEIYKEKREPPAKTVSFLAQVLNRWEHDNAFCGASGKPRALSYTGEQNEFRTMVESVNTNMRPGTVLFELERAGIVVKSGTRVRLVKRENMLTHDPSKALDLLARNVETLIQTVTENVFESPTPANLHLRTGYNNISNRHLPEIRRWFLNKGTKLHAEARNFLSKFDRDLNPKIEAASAGREVVFTTFSLTSPVETESE